MRLVLAPFLMLFAFSPLTLADCKCARPEKGETTHSGGNEMIVMVEQKPHIRLRGIVARGREHISGALVEVFTNPEYLLKHSFPTEAKKLNQKRVAACKTGPDGEFCFKGLSSGKYELRSSINSGWDVTHIYVIVDARKGEDQEIEVEMHLGT